MTGFERLDETLIHQGYIWRVSTARFRAPDGEEFSRDVVRSPGAVGVVPIWVDAEGTPSVVLVRQFRAPYEELVLEIPAGMRDKPGEPPEETARRELMEEVGLQASDMVHLLDMYPSPAMTDSVTTVYLATGLSPVARELHGPEERHMEVLHLPLEVALEGIDRGEIRDAKTVAGLLLAERRLR